MNAKRTHDDDDIYDYDSDRRKIIYVHSNGHSQLVTWLLGIAAALVTGSIITCAALLFNLNSTMINVVYRLSQVEAAVQKAGQ